MSDSIIRVLPKHLANQIAAGEVVQRPASVVKELLENAIDAGAQNIELIVEDAGRTLIHVLDDGQGMSAEDLEVAFERHATSKLSRAEDLFALHTMGFRGEALASIAAVSMVEAQSRRAQDEVGHRLRIEGGAVVEKGICAASEGTGIAVRNLFFNIPARRNFLKSDSVELRHISDEFVRIALAHPERAFRFHHNRQLMHALDPLGSRPRIAQLFGGARNEQLVPVEERTVWISVSGFVGKPASARRSRGEQFLFVNRRFIKSPLIHSAVATAFEGLIAEGMHPAYFLYLDIDPARIDVNIHPTKTEIQFEDEKSLHRLVRVSIRHALGRHNIAPTLDFELDANAFVPRTGSSLPPPPSIRINPDFNPFAQDRAPVGPRSVHYATEPEPEFVAERLWKAETDPAVLRGLLFADFALMVRGNRLVFVDPKRVLFERTLREESARWAEGNALSQRLLFPHTMGFNPTDAARLVGWLPQLSTLGFDFETTEEGTLVLQGAPLGVSTEEAEALLHEWLETPLDEPDSEQIRWKRTLDLALCKSASQTFAGRETELQAMGAVLDQWNWPERDALGRLLWWSLEPSQIAQKLDE
ncbi:DNA mismatch repair endonuclease MutL [bacterium]|nr:DNA mismatch repair endonuclease MutL [bacterium]